MAAALLIALALLTYANPILVVWILVRRLVGKRAEEPKWSVCVFWISLRSAAAALTGFWVATPFAPTALEHNDAVFRGLLKGSTVMATAALILAIVGRSKGRSWIALSALITPLSWFWGLMIQ